jgi:pimeloyl-ACP methyl ester carboxylesterase
MSLPNPVIMVPGITASELQDEYPIDFQRVYGLVSKDFLRIALHPDDTRYEAREPARVVAARVFNLIYGEIVRELRHNLSSRMDQPVPVYAFPYDWRQPLEITAEKLADFIQEVAERTDLLPHYHRGKYGQNPKVNLIGHSMGGLIIAEHLAQSKGKHLVGKVATMGSPFRGSHEAVLKVVTGTAEFGTNPSSSREREVARMTPALYYLTPSYKNAIRADAGFPNDLFQPGAWQPSVINSIREYVRVFGLDKGPTLPRAEEIFSTMLKNAGSHRHRTEKLKLKEVGLSEDDWLAIIGVGEKTRVRLHIQNRNGKPWFDLASTDRRNDWKPGDWKGKVLTGDGTVPFEGAIPSFLSEENLVCVSDDDFGYWEFKDRLLEGVAAGLHATLPLMNLVQRLIASHFLGRQFGSVWGRPSPNLGDATWSPPIRKLEQK